jgi:nucleoside-diphosphate-sugar epimerase
VTASVARPRRALVTGAAGFVGANLTRKLLELGHELYPVLRASSDRWRLAEIEDRTAVVELDLADRAAVVAAVESIRPQWVFHLAAHGAYSHQTDVEAIVRTNITGTVNLLEACLDAGFETFVNTGSSSEYGFKDHAPAEEESLEPNSHYAWTKAAATNYCRHTATLTGRRIPTVRLYSVFGPYEEPGRLIPTLVISGMAGELPPLVDAAVSRDYVYVDDVCDAYLAAAVGPIGEPGAVYNVGTGTQTTVADVVEVARRQLGITARPQWGAMPNRSWDTAIWVALPNRIQADLGWQARHDFEQGFKLCVDWFNEHPELRSRYRVGIDRRVAQWIG